MKTRHGFVSNSSSTSFMIYGATFDADEIKRLVEIDVISSDDFDDLEEISNAVYDKLKGTGLTMYHPYDGYIYYVGSSPLNMKDDMTMGQFKEGVRKKIEDVLSKKDCSFMERTVQS